MTTVPQQGLVSCNVTVANDTAGHIHELQFGDSTMAPSRIAQADSQRKPASRQGWPNRAESRSSESRLGDSAKTSDSRLSDSAILALQGSKAYSPFTYSCWARLCRTSLSLKHLQKKDFNIPSKHFEFVCIANHRHHLLFE